MKIKTEVLLAVFVLFLLSYMVGTEVDDAKTDPIGTLDIRDANGNIHTNLFFKRFQDDYTIFTNEQGEELSIKIYEIVDSKDF